MKRFGITMVVLGALAFSGCRSEYEHPAPYYYQQPCVPACGCAPACCNPCGATARVSNIQPNAYAAPGSAAAPVLQSR